VSQSRVNRILEKRAKAAASRTPTMIPQDKVRGPFTEAQAALIGEQGYRSLQAYRTLLFRMRFGQGAERLAQTASDWRVAVIVPPTVWFVERDHFLGIRNADGSDMEKARLHLRTVGPGAPRGGAPAMPYPGSVYIAQTRVGTGSGTQIEYLFEHDDLDRQERYLFTLAGGWQAFQRPTGHDPWAEVVIESESVS